MKILVTEDNDRKYNAIESVVLELFPHAIIRRATFVKEALRLYLDKADDQIVFDVLVQDMFLPISYSTGIDRKGGIYALKNIVGKGLVGKIVVCSSDAISKTYMDEEGFGDIPFIDYSSPGFKSKLKEFLLN